jgi:putative colanic acid biosysnthesis UDP-glucose lipid carrier transferase
MAWHLLLLLMTAEESSTAERLATALLPRSSPILGGLPRRSAHVGTMASPALTLLREWLSPFAVVLSLAACLLLCRQTPSARYAALGLLAFLLSRQAFRPLDSQICHSDGLPPKAKLWHLLVGWGIVLTELTIAGILLGVADSYPRHLLLWWFGLTPIALLLANHCAERLAKYGSFATRRHVIIGADGVGAELARRIQRGSGPDQFMGFFDFRSPERLPDAARPHFAGHCRQLATFVREHTIDAIHIALPLSNVPRIAELLRELRDTTASVYFVPNVFAFDPIQPHCIDINGMAVVSICDTPFHGMNGVRKRVMDLLLGAGALLFAWPLLLLLALLVKLSSPGPVLFKQRRYGLNGEEILVYKFRTMTVCEDSERISQAVRCDVRVTPIGRLLRRRSLDELPQIFNVLAGQMSFVGPRPHAVAHNEQYRRLISGYMIRHKIRPGITGWAQINGHRGETDTLEKMRGRVECDLEYLKNWSVWLDLKIISKTALMFLTDRNAY